MVTRRGTPGNDRLVGTPGDDVIFGRGGNDRIAGLSGDDRLFGDAGRDVLSGGAGDDLLMGGSNTNGVSDFATDQLYGGWGDDFVNGRDSSSDRLFGGAGNDHLSVANDVANGGDGRDEFEVLSSDGRLTGGDGGDTFNITFGRDLLSNRVEILDFQDGGDRMIVDFVDPLNGHLFGGELFERMDTNDDGILDGTDASSTVQPEGYNLGVTAESGGLTVAIDDDTIRFENVAQLDGAWL